MKKNVRLNNILDEFVKSKFSLKTFFIACLESKDARVQLWVKNFYSSNGPAAAFGLWTEQITKPEDVETAVPAAVDFVLKHLTDEMAHVTADAKLRLAASKITTAKATNFNLRFIEKRFQMFAPNVLSILNGLTGENARPSRNPSAIAVVVASMLATLRSRKSNYFQMIMGIYLFSKGASRKLISVLSNCGLSVSHQSIMRSLNSLTEDSRKNVKSVARVKPWYLVYDNINMAFRKHDQRLNNQDSFDSGTTATIIISTIHAEEESGRSGARHLCLADLMPSKDNDIHLRNAFRFHLIDVLRRCVPVFSECAISAPTKKLLPIEKTATFPMPSMRIDQSTIEGNKDVIETIMEEALGLPQEWFNGRRILIAGDQLTVNRIRSLKQLRWDDISTYHRLDWAIPVMQLFHLQMLFASTILRTHYGSVATPGSLAYNASLLERRRVNLDNPDFHATDELLNHTFDALVLRAWGLVLECDDLNAFTLSDPNTQLCDVLTAKADILIDQYLVTENLEQLNSTASQNAALLLRDLLLYKELNSGTKAGDVGRIEEIIKWLTIIFQAGSTKNYANELLHLHCGLSYSWTPKTKEAVLSSLVVNTSGQENRWIPADLYQEHNNLLTKTIHSAKGSNLSWEMLAEAVSANIRTFELVSQQVEKEFNISYSGSNHATVSANQDINLILTSTKENGIFSLGPAPNRPHIRDIPQVKNLFVEGLVKLTEEGRLEKFKTCVGVSEYGAETNEIDIDMEQAVVDFEIDEYIQKTVE
ncbi:hypothetical protein BGZ51_009411 [Haplosporangium sp. Z 767]|nr:hypothetical protein BGZ51_009411 [Haplosporangium sp. Z 767]